MNSKKMKAAVLNDDEDLRIEKVDIPTIGSEEVLISVEYCGVCGTDNHLYKGNFPSPKPLILGHEFSGVVAEVGNNVSNVKKGDKVTADINMSCGVCYYCRTGNKLFCNDVKQLGVHIDGAFAEYIKAPASNVYKIPDEMSLFKGAFIEPLACVVHGQERTNITLGSSVAIIGAGTMGLTHAALAKLNGASRVIISEMNPERISKAKEMGVDYVINAKEVDPVEEVMRLTDGRGADYVIEAVGSIPTYTQAFKMVKRGGSLTVYGAAPADAEMTIKPFEIYSKELTIVGTYAGTYDTWVKAIELLKTNRFDPTPLISKTISLDELENELKSPDPSSIKTFVSPKQ